jgi:hypothetical protein
VGCDAVEPGRYYHFGGTQGLYVQDKSINCAGKEDTYILKSK